MCGFWIFLNLFKDEEGSIVSSTSAATAPAVTVVVDSNSEETEQEPSHTI